MIDFQIVLDRVSVRASPPSRARDGRRRRTKTERASIVRGARGRAIDDAVCGARGGRRSRVRTYKGFSFYASRGRPGTTTSIEATTMTTTTTTTTFVKSDVSSIEVVYAVSLGSSSRVGGRRRGGGGARGARRARARPSDSSVVHSHRSFHPHALAAASVCAFGEPARRLDATRSRYSSQNGSVHRRPHSRATSHELATPANAPSSSVTAK